MDKNRNSLFASILKTVSALLGIMSLKTDLFTSVENVRPAVSTRVRLRLQTGQTSALPLLTTERYLSGYKIAFLVSV